MVSSSQKKRVDSRVNPPLWERALIFALKLNLLI